MTRGARRYAGPRAVVWPMHKGALGVGCALFVWLLLVVGLGLAVFSLALSARLLAVLNDHFGVAWLGLAAASLVWPLLYLRAGWFRTLFGYWPAPEEESGIGPACETCGSTIRRGRTRNGHFVCDVCVRQRVLDNRRLIVPAVVMVGLAFVGNGLSSLLQVHGPPITALLGPTASRWLQMLEAMGTMGSVGLVVSGGLILARIIGRMVRSPLGARAMDTARAQIGAALDREHEEAEMRPEAITRR